MGDTSARDRLTAELVASVALGDAAGGQAMFEAALSDPAVVTGLALCQSDLHRSFWLYVRHRALFERASDLDFWAHHSAQAQQYDLGVRRPAISTDAALAGLRRAISAYYQRERQCGEGCVAYLAPRSPGIHLLTVHVKDLAELRLEFEGVVLKQRVGNPNIHMVLEYAEATGVVRTPARGGHKVQQMLVEAFAEHVLGVKAMPERIKAPALDSSALRTGFDVPEVFEDGFSLVQLKSLTLLSPEGDLKIECTAMQASQHRSVHELLRDQLPGPLEGRWAVLAAQINLYYPPEPGRTRARVVPIEVTSRGRLNLHQFDAAASAAGALPGTHRHPAPRPDLERTGGTLRRGHGQGDDSRGRVRCRHTRAGSSSAGCSPRACRCCAPPCRARWRCRRTWAARSRRP